MEKRKQITLLQDGEPAEFWLASPTAYAQECYMRMCLEAGVGFDVQFRSLLVDPDAPDAKIAELDAQPRETRRMPEWKREKAAAVSAKAEMDAMPERDRARSDLAADNRRIQYEFGIQASAMLAALLTDSPGNDGPNHEPIHVYGRVEAQRMIPSEGDSNTLLQVSELWMGVGSPNQVETGTA